MNYELGMVNRSRVGVASGALFSAGSRVQFPKQVASRPARLFAKVRGSLAEPQKAAGLKNRSRYGLPIP